MLEIILKLLNLLNPFGVSYEEEPVVSIRIPNEELVECRRIHATPLLSGYDNMINTLEEVIGTDQVKVRKYYGNYVRLYDKSIKGNQMSVKELLEKFGSRGYPGYDRILNGIDLYKGTTNFDKEVYRVSPTAYDCVDEEVDMIEVYPIK